MDVDASVGSCGVIKVSMKCSGNVAMAFSFFFFFLVCLGWWLVVGGWWLVGWCVCFGDL